MERRDPSTSEPQPSESRRSAESAPTAAIASAVEATAQLPTPGAHILPADRVTVPDQRVDYSNWSVAFGRLFRHCTSPAVTEAEPAVRTYTMEPVHRPGMGALAVTIRAGKTPPCLARQGPAHAALVFDGGGGLVSSSARRRSYRTSTTARSTSQPQQLRLSPHLPVRPTRGAGGHRRPPCRARWS